MQLSLFDLHCDTASEMLATRQGLRDNRLAVSLKKAEVFTHYVQVMAHWTDRRLDDEQGWQRFFEILENLRNDPAVLDGSAVISTACPPHEHPPTLILAVEDARIVAGKLERIDLLYQNGVRILTPLWYGETCIGGSHNTSVGLTDFGKAALRRAAEFGMLLDISHASYASASEIFELSEELHRPVIASHSNAYDICPVSRNLRREQIDAVLRSGGVIGINLYQGFLKENAQACAADTLTHIEYFLEAGAENALCLGCDMDGCTLPEDIPDVASLPHLAELMLAHNYSETLIRALFYDNAYRFASIHLCG